MTADAVIRPTDALDPGALPQYDLMLFVSGASDLSARAITNVRALCDHQLRGRADLRVVDVHDEPALARRHRVVASPTLLRTSPAPQRRLVGDLADAERVMRLLLSPAAVASGPVS